MTKNIISYLFILLQINKGLTIDFNNSYVNITEMEKTYSNITVHDFVNCFNYLETINKFIVKNIDKLFIIIAQDMKTGIELAESLTNNNRLLPKKIEENAKNIDNEIIENYYLYYNGKKSVHVLVYPRNVRNETIAVYLMKKTLESVKKFKIALTCYSLNNLNFTFSIAAKILKNNYSKLDGSVIFLPLSMKQENLTSKEKFEYIVLRSSPKNFGNSFNLNQLSENPEIILTSNYTKMDSNFIDSSLRFDDNEENLKSFNDTLSSMGEKIFHGTYKMDMSTVIGVLKFSKWISELKIENIVQEDSVSHFCKSRKQLEVVRLVCFFKYMSNGTCYNSTAWKNSLKLFLLNNLQEKQQWLRELIQFYNEGTYENESSILQRFNQLQENVSDITSYDGNLMKKALFDINNVVNVKSNISCSLYCENSALCKETYKLEIRGKFLNLAQILHKNYCSGKKVMHLELFALEKIIINKNIVGGYMQFTIIAPIWEVISRRVINLDGTPPNNNWRDEQLLPFYIRSERKVYIDGLPGLPGETGGSFFGIFDMVIKGENLRISSDGGMGGDGQNGANGLATIEFNDIVPRHKYRPLSYQSRYIHVPGYGGNKGQGGLPGIIKLLSLSNFTKLEIQTSLKNGTDGKDGITGTYFRCYEPICGFLIKEKDNAFDKRSSSRDVKKERENYIKMANSKLTRKTPICDFTPSIVNYRKYVITTTMEIGTTSGYSHLYRKLNKADLVTILNPTVFIDELFMLENYYSLRLNTPALLPTYEACFHGINQYISDEKYISSSKNNTKRMLTKLNEIIARRINALYEGFYENPVLVINVFVKESVKRGNILRNGEIINKIEEIGKDYKSSFENEIKEFSTFLDRNLPEYLDKRIDDLKMEIKKLVKEVDELIKKKKENIESLDKKKQTLKSNIILSIIFTSLKIILISVSFINPACAVIGAVFTTGISILESQVMEPVNVPTKTDIPLPSAVTDSVVGVFKTYKENREEELKQVKAKLTEIQDERRKLQETGENTDLLTTVEKKISKTCVSSPTSSPNQCMLEIYEHEEKNWNEKSEKKYQKSMTTLKKVMVTADATKLGIESYNTIGKSLSASEEIDLLIEKEIKEIKKLEAFKNKIYKDLEPQVENIRHDLRNTTKGFYMSSRALLEYEKFRMDDYFRQISSELDKWTNNFKISEEVKKTIDQVKSAMNMIIRMHFLINEFRMKIKNAEYFQHVAVAPLQIDFITDSSIQKSLTKLEQVQISNDIIINYEKLIVAVKSFTFPFTNDFFAFTSNTVDLFDSSLIKGCVIHEKMKNLLSNMNLLKAYSKDFPHDNFTVPRKFGIGNSPAFYVWKNKSYSSQIKNILKGKQVILFVNISREKKMNAIKFCEVGINFVSVVPKLKKKKEKMKVDFSSFKAVLTHHGDSYYRCVDKIHLIKSGASVWSHVLFGSIEPSRPANNYILSPFANWTVELQYVYNKIGDSDPFAVLSKYVNKVNIELIGYGQFVHSIDNVCKNDLSKEYGKEVLLNT